VENLGGLKRLEKLMLSNNNVKSLSGLSVCQSLRELDLGSNSVEVVREVEWLTEIPKLAKLTLQDNECASLEFYRLRVLARLTGLSSLDAEAVTAEEKVKGINLYGREGSDLQNRVKTWAKHFGETEFVNFQPAFIEPEADPKDEKKEDGGEVDMSVNTRASMGFVSGVLDDAMKSALASP
jgi:hypothetical protein